MQSKYRVFSTDSVNVFHGRAVHTGEQRTLYSYINAQLLNAYISTTVELYGSVLNTLLIYQYTKRLRLSKFETCK